MPLVGNLDSDGLLAGNRGQDPDVGGGERVGEVILELGHLGHLGPGRKPQLVARDAGADHAPDDLGLDPEVAEGLDEQLRDLVLVGRVRALIAARALEERGIGKAIVDLVGLGDRRPPVSHRRELELLRRVLDIARGLVVRRRLLPLGGGDLPLDSPERVRLVRIERLVLGGERLRGDRLVLVEGAHLRLADRLVVPGAPSRVLPGLPTLVREPAAKEVKPPARRLACA